MLCSSIVQPVVKIGGLGSDVDLRKVFAPVEFGAPDEANMRYVI